MSVVSFFAVSEGGKRDRVQVRLSIPHATGGQREPPFNSAEEVPQMAPSGTALIKATNIEQHLTCKSEFLRPMGVSLCHVHHSEAQCQPRSFKSLRAFQSTFEHRTVSEMFEMCLSSTVKTSIRSPAQPDGAEYYELWEKSTAPLQCKYCNKYCLHFHGLIHSHWATGTRYSEEQRLSLSNQHSVTTCQW